MSTAAAERLAEQGYRVFPLGVGTKKPRPGFKDWPTRATSDLLQVKTWWGASGASGVGIACGHGLVVVDLDVKNDKDGVREWTRWAAEHGVKWQPTVTTPSGGQHVYFRTDDTFTNSVGLLPGVDVRSAGGYVVSYAETPPLKDLPTLPPAVGRLLARKDGEAPSSAGERRVGAAGVRAAVDAETFRLSGCPEGQRNDTLNSAAYNVGQLVGPHLSEEDARVQLREAALECGLEQSEALSTIESGLTAGMANLRDTSEGEPERGAWTPVDLGALLAGNLEPLNPALLARSDGLCLLYPGRTHSVSGESGSGKSWLAQWATAETLRNGGRVLYLDYESSPSSVVIRLLALGCSQEDLSRLVYVNPEAAPSGAEFEALLRETFALAVVDGVTESLGLSGLSGDNLTNSNDAITRWHAHLPKRIARETGAAVVQVDHVTKAKDNRGGYAIGGQAKRASITGAAYVVTPRESFGRGRSGSFDLFVSKDREGFILGALSGDDTSAGRLAARVVIESAAEGEQVTLTLEAGSPAKADRGDVMKETIMGFLATLPADHKGASTAMVRREVQGTNSRKEQALEELVAEGYVTREPVGQSMLHRFARPYTPFEDVL